MRASEEFCLPTEPGRRAGFIRLFFPFHWVGVSRSATKRISRVLSTLSSMGELQRHPGIAFGRQHLLFSVQSRGRSWDGWVLEQHHSTRHSGFRLHGVAFRGADHARQAIIVFRKPPMYVNLADDMHFRSRPEAVSRIQYTTVLVISPLLSISPLIMPSGLCRRR